MLTDPPHNIPGILQVHIPLNSQVFRRKYAKLESSASVKQRFNRLFFDPENQKLPDFLEKKTFGDNAHQMTENLFYAKMPPHLENYSIKPTSSMEHTTRS